MRKYYLFNVKDDLNRIYKYNPYGLYKTIEDMFNIKKIKYEVALYNELCNLIDGGVIKYYIEHTYKCDKHDNKYLLNNSLIEINKSCLVIESKDNIPEIFKCLKTYSKNFLVIDFNNNDYFWLNRYV